MRIDNRQRSTHQDRVEWLRNNSHMLGERPSIFVVAKHMKVAGLYAQSTFIRDTFVGLRKAMTSAGMQWSEPD